MSTFVVGKQSFIDGCISLAAAVDKHAALAAMGADFEVKLEPIQVVGGAVVPDRFAAVRQDTLDPLEVVGGKYTVCQNISAGDIADSLVAKKEALYHAGRLMDGGRRMCLIMKRPATFSVVQGDDVDSFINIVNSHDGQSSLTVWALSARKVSGAILSVYNTPHQGAVKIRHTKGIANTNDIVDAVNMVRGEFQALEAASKKLVGKQLTQAQLDKFFSIICPNATAATPVSRSVNTMEDILSYFHNGTGNNMAGVKGSAWALFSGLSEWVDFMSPTRGSKDPNEARAKSQLFGSNRKLKQRAFDLLMQI